MKRAAFLLTTFILAFSLQAQTNYKVIKVNGKIQYVRTGSKMSLGDVFAEDESLSFETPNSRAAVINPEKGRFILTPESASQLSGARSNFLPAMSNISTRGGALNSLNDIQNQFEGPVAIIYRASWHINPYQYPMDENSFFYLQFQYKGESINKKLQFDENKLIFSRDEILRVDDQPVQASDSPNTILYYHSPDGSQYISSFDLIFPVMEMLKSETGIILEEFSGHEYSRKVNEISGYLYEFYGKPDKEDVMLFLEKEFGLKK
ncbi:MAG: hypothetical protein KAT15_20055 [Bacteroidales bacterium]|nr:hypothetical protein [Bacteroidales bacterium]